MRSHIYIQTFLIEAPNRAVIELASPGGRLTLENGARFDLRSGDKGGHYGSIDLNARRLGGATGDDIDIDAAGALNIAGARTVNVNAFWQYKDAPAGAGISTAAACNYSSAPRPRICWPSTSACRRNTRCFIR